MVYVKIVNNVRMHVDACMCIGRHLKQTVLWGTIRGLKWENKINNLKRSITREWRQSAVLK